MATTRTIENAWENRYLPDIFYEQPSQMVDVALQQSSLRRVITLLRARYCDCPDTFMSGIVSISYKVPDDTARFAPEFFIAFDVPDVSIRQDSPNFFIWRLGKTPDFVIEIASPTTYENDLEHKRDMYAELGITEYWRFDPTGGDFYGQPLAGERLVDGEYQPYEMPVDDDGSVIGYSELLDLNFYWDGDEFDVLDPETGKTIDKYEVEREARQAERLEFEAREREHQAREQELLDEISRLRHQLDD